MNYKNLQSQIENHEISFRWERLDEDLAYDSDQLDRAVVAPDQIRTVVRTYKGKVGRTWVPKTLIFAKDDLR